MSNPLNSTKDGEDRRSYTWPPTGEVFPSVTTILSAVNKPALIPWAAKQAATYAVHHQNDWAWLGDKHEAVKLISGAYKRTMENSSAIGTHVHECIEASIDLLDQPNPTPEHMRHFEAWKLAFNPKFMLSEATVYNRTVGYAGTLDILADINGVQTLIDVKTGKSVYPEVSLQLAAYANGEFVGVMDEERPMPKIEAAAVLHLRMTGYRFIPVSIEPEVFTTFRHVNEVFRWMAYGSHNVLGAQSKLVTDKSTPMDGATPTTSDGESTVTQPSL